MKNIISLVTDMITVFSIILVLLKWPEHFLKINVTHSIPPSFVFENEQISNTICSFMQVCKKHKHGCLHFGFVYLYLYYFMYVSFYRYTWFSYFLILSYCLTCALETMSWGFMFALFFYFILFLTKLHKAAL